MAEIRSIHADRRKSVNRNGSDRNRQTYVDGTAVRKLKAVEQPVKKQQGSSVPRTGRRSARRERPQYFSIGYTLFLAAASVLTLWVCAGYLKLQADNTARSKNIVALEEQLSDLRAENDDEYNRVTSSVDLEEVRNIAINELGMVYAEADQVVLYDGSGSDYVKQYAEIPQEESGLKGVLGAGGR